MSTLTGDVIKDLFDRPVSPNMWQVTANPAAAAQAIATKSAGAAGVKHVCWGVVATIACGATAQTPITVQVLDGAAVIFTAQLAAPANGVGVLSVTGLGLIGTAATSMTLQFSGAGVAASVENVTLIGYDVD